MRRSLRLGLPLSLFLAQWAWGSAQAAPWQFRAMPSPDQEMRTGGDGQPYNGLPVGWKFVAPPPGEDYPTGQSNVSVSFDPLSGTILETYREGDVEVREPLVITPEEYNQVLTDRNRRKLWQEDSRQTRSVARGQARNGGIFRVELPVQLPKLVRSVVGDGAPNIEVSGSETITLSGTRDWNVGPRVQTERKNQAGFPSLEMKQDMNVNLTGSIGDRIKVDVDQSSNVQTSVDNKVKLRYEGDDDDMIRLVELGNTNLSVEGASFRQEGLFGIKTIAKLGNVEMTAIASKQDAKTETARFTPSGDNKQVQIGDLDYIKRTYYLISDRPIRLKPGTLQIYRDNGFSIDNSQGNIIKALARLDPSSPPDTLGGTNPERNGNFTPLDPGTDYEKINPWLIDDSSGREIPVIRLLTALQPQDVLAVSYTMIDDTGAEIKVGDVSPAANPVLGKPADISLLKMVKPPFDDFPSDPVTGLMSPSAPWYRALFYELHNFYDIGGRDIALETLNLKIRSINAGGANNPEAVDVGGRSVPLVQILGLDQQSLPGADNLNIPDGRVDSQFLNPVTGILFFPDLHPFAPDTTNPTGLCNTAGGFGSYNCLDNFGRNILRDDPALPAASRSNLSVYYSRNPNAFTDSRFYIDADFKSSQQGFFLGRFDILENSEQVKVDGIPQRRGIDYSIDYSAGQITFVKPPGPQQTISVDYSFAPGIGSTQLTLLGGSASYNPGPNFSLTSSVLYDKRGAQETNPKLGEEPAESVIGDLASVVTFRPVWMTGFANAIPGVRTTTPSTLNIQGHAAVSVPNPNTAGEAYIDDMEGNRESSTASLSRTQWFWSSTPEFDKGDSLSPPVPNDVPDHSIVSWYNPPKTDPDVTRYAVERDLKPVLKDEEGGGDLHNVLEMNFQPPTGQSGLTQPNWAGVTQSLGVVGQDFSKLSYLEIWVNDFTPDHALTQGKLHIDFGNVSEDAFWDPNNPPNGTLDTEDKSGDGKLDTDSNDKTIDEDTGLDGIHDVDETGYNPPLNVDPNQDDYGYDREHHPEDYAKINNTEGNSKGDPNGRPDTEDLNRDGFLDKTNNYFEATIDLSDTSFVAIDVPKDYANKPGVVGTIKATNGWRLFRIPLNLGAFKSVNQANWESVSHLRLWMNGMTTPTRVQIGGIELVGNRWLAQAIPTAAATRVPPVTLGVGVRNNKDDADLYHSPYEVQNTVGGTSTRKEQSLALRFSGLEYGDSVLAFKTTGSDQSGLGWTQYGQVRFWLHGENGVDVQNLRAIARFGADTVNYYEYSVPVRSGWQNLVIPMDYLSRIKETQGSARVKVDSLTAASTGEVYTVVGSPSFTRMFRISFGITSRNDPGNTLPTSEAGEIWINDLRLSDVNRDRGMSGNMSVQANFADVVALNASYENTDENFFRVGSGTNQGSGVNHAATSFSTTFNVDRLVPTSQIQVPLRYSMQHSTDVPKFRTGSDVILSGARSELETRTLDRQSVDVSYRRSAPRRGIAKYTIDALSGGATYNWSGSVNTNSIDSSWSFSASTAYDLPVGGGGIGLGRKMKVNLLPDVIGFSSGWLSTRDVSYGRALLDVGDSVGLRSDVKQRVLNLGGSSSWTPLSSVRLRFGINSIRNMLLTQPGSFGFNKGTEVDQRRTLELNYVPRWLSILSPNLNMSGRYHQSTQPSLRLLPTDPDELKSIDNGGSTRLTAVLPLTRFAQRAGPRPGGKGGPTVFTPVRLVVSKLQDVQGTFTIERLSTISRVTGDPGFWFMTGFTGSTDPGLERINNSISITSTVYTTGANTTVRPTNNLTIDVRADNRLTYADNGLGPRRQLTRAIPDVKARWLELHRLFGLSNTISSMSMNSGYNFRHDETGPEGGAVEQMVSTTNWAPLLGWDLSWRNGLRANISTNVIQETTVDERIFGAVGDRQSVNTDITFTKVFPASRGIRFPWNRKPIKLPNDLNLNLRVSATSDRKITKRESFPDIVELNNQRLSVTSATNYNFTSAISGGFNLGFTQNQDLKTEITTRSVTIALNGQFRF